MLYESLKYCAMCFTTIESELDRGATGNEVLLNPFPSLCVREIISEYPFI